MVDRWGRSNLQSQSELFADHRAGADDRWVLEVPSGSRTESRAANRKTSIRFRSFTHCRRRRVKAPVQNEATSFGVTAS